MTLLKKNCTFQIVQYISHLFDNTCNPVWASKHAHLHCKIFEAAVNQSCFIKLKERFSIDSKSWMLIGMKSKECKPCLTRLPKQHPTLSTCDLSEKCLKQKRN